MKSTPRYYTKIDTGVTLSYLDVGEGPALLLIHGYPGTAESHLGGVIADLSHDYRVIAPDLRGCGASRPPNRDFPVDFYARDAADMAALLVALKTGPVAAVGFSDGGETALLLAASRPDLVWAVVGWGVCGVISKAMVDSITDWLPVSAWGPDREARRRAIIDRHGEEQLEPIVRGWHDAAHAILARGGNVCLEEAARIKAPALVMNGDREVGNTPEDVAALVRRIPRGELVFIEDSGHFIQDDQPAALLAHLRAFLRRNAP
jgi:valacyclovir hydrolase